MNFAWFEKIAPQLANPLVLVGFVLMLAYVIHWQLMKSGLLSKVDKQDSGLIIQLFLRYASSSDHFFLFPTNSRCRPRPSPKVARTIGDARQHLPPMVFGTFADAAV